MRINFFSRIANKVYLEIATWYAQNFDQLFDLVKKSNYSQYLSNSKISLKVQTKNSQLSSVRTIQSVAHKALLESIAQFWKEEPFSTDFFLMLEDNIAHLYLNTSGAALYQRWYRQQTGSAPIKENLAAAILLLSSWKFKSQLIDPFCGSGTIAIEAALLAKNIAPWTWRSFAFETFKNYENWTFQSIKNQAKDQIFHGEYQIAGYDNDPKMITLAQENARQAGVADLITFEVRDFLKTDFSSQQKSRIVTNPPYGKRLWNQDLEACYKKLLVSFTDNIFGGWISSYPVGELPKELWNQKKLFNGDEPCSFFSRRLG